MRTTVQITFDSLDQHEEFIKWLKSLDEPVGYTTTVSTGSSEKEKPKKEKPKKEEPKKEEPKKEEPKKEEPKVFSNDELKKVVNDFAIANPGAIAGIRNAVKSRGVSKANDIPQEEREAFLKEIGAI